MKEICPGRLRRFVACTLLMYLIGCSRTNDISDASANTIFKLGFQTDKFSTGPLSNSGYILKLNDAIPPLFVTAHHVVAGTNVPGRYLKWNEIKDNVHHSRIWSMHDSTYQIQLGTNIPIPNAQTLKLDIAAFHLPSSQTSYLIPSPTSAAVGDTVTLFSKIIFNGITTLSNDAIVTYASDSVLVYELLHFEMANIMSGTSGSAILNRDGQVVASSYAGFTIPNEEVRREIEPRFPLLKVLTTKNGKTYGAGVPIRLVEDNLLIGIRGDR